MRRYFNYASHAEVLRDHPAFSWDAVVDPSPDALERARTKYGIAHLWPDIEAMDHAWCPDVAVLATPPGARLALLKKLPTLRAVLVEKPLAQSALEATEFTEACAAQSTLAQVNYLRRGDAYLRSLAAGGLEAAVGSPRTAVMTYGGGLFNMASHLVDLTRMLLGEVRAVQALGPVMRRNAEDDDPDLPFVLHMKSGVLVTAQVADPTDYREAGLDIWGTRGRLALMQEGLGIYRYPRTENRGVADAFEIDSGTPEITAPTLGDALYRMYDNLADALAGDATLWSDTASAGRTETVLHAIRHSAECDGLLTKAA